MEQKDPKDMTASELLRCLADNDDQSNCRACHIFYASDECGGLKCSSWKRDLADKIDAELAQARSEALLQGAQVWAKDNGWPDFKDGEDFGAWLDRCALKLPCDKDGEPWNIGDRVIPGNHCESTVTGYAFDGSLWFLKYRWCGIDSYANEFATSCKRPAPEVLGADGKPIKVGETVYPIDGEWIGIPLEVSGIESPTSVKVYLSAGKSWTTFHADSLTHTPPDTQERIDADAQKDHIEYWQCSDIECGECPSKIDDMTPQERYECNGCDSAMTIDLLRRQRELDARKGGVE